MDEQPRSNRPTPRTPAAIEAELRRHLRSELAQARADADGVLDDAALAEIIAHAIGSALEWHLESPEHMRNATMSSRTWRGAPGPRGPQRDAPRDRDRDRDFGRGGFGSPRRPPSPPQRDFDDRFSDADEPFPPRPRGPRPPPPPPRGGGPRRPPSRGGGGGGGFGPRKPRRGG